VDRRRALHRELIASARAEFPQMLATEVPNWAEIERLSVRRAPLGASAPASAAAALYARLWREIRERTGEAVASALPATSSAGAVSEELPQGASAP